MADLSAADLSEVTGDGVLNIVTYTGDFYRKQNLVSVKCAVYVPQGLPDVMKRVYEVFISESVESSHFFDNYEKAEMWLKIA